MSLGLTRTSNLCRKLVLGSKFHLYFSNKKTTSSGVNLYPWSTLKRFLVLKFYQQDHAHPNLYMILIPNHAVLKVNININKHTVLVSVVFTFPIFVV